MGSPRHKIVGYHFRRAGQRPRSLGAPRRLGHEEIRRGFHRKGALRRTFKCRNRRNRCSILAPWTQPRPRSIPGVVRGVVAALEPALAVGRHATARFDKRNLRLCALKSGVAVVRGRGGNPSARGATCCHIEAGARRLRRTLVPWCTLMRISATRRPRRRRTSFRFHGPRFRVWIAVPGRHLPIPAQRVFRGDVSWPFRRRFARTSRHRIARL